MILATWNCHRGPLVKKLAALTRLNADLVVVPELPRLQPEQGLWRGNNQNMGIAVVPNRTTNLVPIDNIPDLPDNMLPVHVTVPSKTTFFLLAVWTKGKPENDRYIRSLHRALSLCEKLMAVFPTVIMGDFNSNTVWDHEHPLDRNHTAFVKRLNDLGLVSAYHSYFNEKQGQEKQHTFYLSKKLAWPSHIDYCFLPESWIIRNVAVGSFEDWRELSDHTPLSVRVEQNSAM